MRVRFFAVAELLDDIVDHRVVEFHGLWLARDLGEQLRRDRILDRHRARKGDARGPLGIFRWCRGSRRRLAFDLLGQRGALLQIEAPRRLRALAWRPLASLASRNASR